MQREQLVEAVAAGIDFEALVTEHQPSLLRLARRLVWDAEEARDMVQSALADAYARRGGLRDAVAAPAWLRRILVHRAVNHLRRRRVWDAVRHALHLEPPPAPSPEETVGHARALAAVAETLRRLPARQATAFTLRYLEGLGLDDIAQAMEIDRGTVRVHLQRALRKVRERGPWTGVEP